MLYIVYSLRLFFSPATSVYPIYIAIGIATFTFAELGINIRGILFYRHHHTPLVHAIKTVNLAASLVCLSLTQMALLSFKDAGAAYLPMLSSLMGIGMGSIAALLGLLMILRTKRGQNAQQAEQTEG